MMEQKKREYPEKIINAFLTEARAVDIRKSAGISNTKYYALKNDPDFQKIITERRTEIMKTAVKRMENNFVKNADALQEIIEDKNISPQVRINALRLYGEWKQSGQITTEIIERIERIENEGM